MVSLASEFKYFIHIFGTLFKSISVFVLVLNINFNFENLPNALRFLIWAAKVAFKVRSVLLMNLDSLAFGMVKTLLLLKLLKEWLGNEIILHSVSSHKVLVKVIRVRDYISLHALVVYQVYLQSKLLSDILARLNVVLGFFNFIMLQSYYSQTCIFTVPIVLVGLFFLRLFRICVEVVCFYHWVPVILN